MHINTDVKSVREENIENLKRYNLPTHYLDDNAVNYTLGSKLKKLRKEEKLYDYLREKKGIVVWADKDGYKARCEAEFVAVGFSLLRKAFYACDLIILEQFFNKEEQFIHDKILENIYVAKNRLITGFNKITKAGTGPTPEMQRKIFNYLMQIQNNGTFVIVSSDLPPFAMNWWDKEMQNYLNKNFHIEKV